MKKARLAMRRAKVRTRRTCGAIVAIGASTVLAVSSLAAVAPSAAKAEYYGGCTYSWGTPCYIVYGAQNFLITMDPDHAYGLFANAATNNGYKAAKHDGVERDVCGTIMYNEGTLSPYPWSCNWGEVVTNYGSGITGYSAIGTGVAYYGIALYEMANYGEYGPCGQVGSTC
jgi:hypothetical protein